MYLLQCRQEAKLELEDGSERRSQSPTAYTPEASTATHTPTGASGLHACIKSEEKPLIAFPVDLNVNKRIYIFEGDICALRTDCIMCFTTDGFTGSDEFSRRLLSSKLKENAFKWL